MSSVIEPSSSQSLTSAVGASRSRQDPDRSLHDSLRIPLEYFLSRKGKRIRADLIEVSYQIAGGHGRVAAGVVEFVELLHGGSLIVDDIQDNSRNRRQQEAVHLKFGVPIAINTGNWMYFAALELLADLDTSADQAVSVMKRALGVIKRCHEGQALDLSSSFDRLEPSLIPATVRQISELKTGALTGLAAWLGGVVATDDEVTLEALCRFGRKLGIGLQMQNDFVELQRVACSRCSSDDLRNKRCTWPWAWLASSSSAEEVQQMVKLALNQLPEPQEFAQQLLEKIEITAVSEINGMLEGSLIELQRLNIDDRISDQMNKIIATLELHYV